ncbi:hypothetical protein TcWFU_010100 [Taenia crassiceps]|uniref:Uncharacterized protein n=1 Tax=Taenia crassiceps TaxID=6207 RepID=A0ABR4PYS6_9CEST
MYVASAATSGNECGDSSGSSGPQQGRGVQFTQSPDGGWVGCSASASASASAVPQRNTTLIPPTFHLEPVYLVTALVPSDTACLANSPGSSRPHSSLDLPACDCRLLVGIAPTGLTSSGNPPEDIVYEGVHYRHRSRDEMFVSGCT